jgi:imidazolonepropionase-like amidohydrolase
MQKVIKAKALVDVTKGKVILDAAVVIDGGKIFAVGTQRNTSLLQGQVEVLDFPGKYILPGLINSHAHTVMPGDGSTIETWAQQSNETFLLTAAMNARLALMSGVTTIRDCGGRNGVMFALRKAIDMGIIEGPRFFLAGRMLTITGGHCHQFHGEVDGTDGMKIAVRRLLNEGADFIKVAATGGGTMGTNPAYSSFDVEEIAEAVKIAHRIGKRVAAHCIGILGMKNAIEAGVDHMEHASFLHPDMTQKFDKKLAEKMAEMDMYVTPTLQVYRDMIEALNYKKEEGDISPNEKKMLDDWHYKMEESLKCFKGLLDTGIRCVAGNEAGWRFTPFDRFWQELDLMVKGGMTPMQAIIATTKTAAEAMQLCSEIGSLEVGKQADIIIVDDDPTVDISALSKVSFIMKAGKICLNKQGREVHN